MKSWSLAGLVLILLLMSVLLGKRKKLYADYFLICYFFVSAVGQVFSYAEQTDWMQQSYWMLLGRVLYLAYSPLFFLYVFALTQNRRVPTWLYALVIFPPLVYSIHFFYYYFFVFETTPIDASSGLLYINGVLSWSWLAFVALMVIIEPCYLIWFYIILKRYKKQILESVSNIDRLSLNWVMVLFYIRVLMDIILVPISFLALSQFGVSINAMQHVIEVVSLGYFFALGYWGFNQTTVFVNMPYKAPGAITSYERSGLTDADLKQYHKRLLEVMQSGKPYLNGDLNAADLAKALGVTTNQLSQVLNQIQKQNFYDFVNSFRVEEVKRKMVDPANAHLTLLGIALESGFNSKSTFNSVFRKLTGHTPTEFAKTVNSSKKD